MKLLTLAEAAEALRTSRRTIQRMASTGRLRGFRLNREWRFSPEQLRAALEQPATSSDMAPLEVAVTVNRSAMRAIGRVS